MSTIDALTIRPDLLAALNHYSGPNGYPYDGLFVYTDPETERQSGMSVGQACELAHAVLSREDLNVLKLEQLKRGMHRLGLGRLYEEIIERKI